jgi:hypothetical protein
MNDKIRALREFGYKFIERWNTNDNNTLIAIIA